MATPTIYPSAVIAQISDTHIVAPGCLLDGVDTASMLAASISAVLKLARLPDMVLLTGDLVDSGSPDEYRHLLTLLLPLRDAGIPVFPLVGNHDSRASLSSAFADIMAEQRPGAWSHDENGFIQYSLICPNSGDFRLVMLDTLVSGKAYGELCAARLGWLDDELGLDADTPTLIAMHHPPFRTFIPYMDKMGLRKGGAELAQILGRHRQVQRIISGHIHRAIHTRFPNEAGGIPASVCPSTAHQIQLTMTAEEPGAFIMEPPGFQLHLWHAATGIVSHTVPVGHFGASHLYG